MIVTDVINSSTSQNEPLPKIMLKKITLSLLLLLSFPCLGAPNVVVTIKPLYGLTARIMQGVAEPVLLLPDNASPHTFQLKASNLKQLHSADLILWVGEGLEPFMARPLSTVKPQFGVITFLNIPELHLLALRHERGWEHEHDHDHHDHEKHAIDPHFWLSIDNALIVVNTIEKKLIEHDKVNAALYKKNATDLKVSLVALKKELTEHLKGTQREPFLVYHDGYQYFEKEFNLNAIGTLMLNPHLPLSAKGLGEIKELIEKNHVRCIFRETEFNDTKIESLLNKEGVTFVELDPLGARIKTDKDAYQTIMLGIAKNMGQCLQKSE